MRGCRNAKMLSKRGGGDRASTLREYVLVYSNNTAASLKSTALVVRSESVVPLNFVMAYKPYGEQVLVHKWEARYELMGTNWPKRKIGFLVSCYADHRKSGTDVVCSVCFVWEINPWVVCLPHLSEGYGNALWPILGCSIKTRSID